MSILGSIDEVGAEGAVGWIFQSDTRAPVVVQAVINGIVIGEALADTVRPDLALAGLGDGRCGFHLSFDRTVGKEFLPLVSVRPLDGNVELPRTNITSFLDAYAGLRARFPGAGWTRSMLGGLWVDRLDSRRMLAGRVALGQVAPEAEKQLATFIETGQLTLPGAVGETLPAQAQQTAMSLGENAWAKPPTDAMKTLLTALPRALFTPSVVRFLRAIFDDNPLLCGIVSGRDTSGFLQASTLEALPSPAECVAVLMPLGDDPASVDLVRESHTLPEFNPDGTSRWVAGPATSMALAEMSGASVETLTLAGKDLCVMAAGSLFRLRSAGQAPLILLLTPLRQTPLRFLSGHGPNVTLRHQSGAMLSI